jgi:hypothetical protein
MGEYGWYITDDRCILPLGPHTVIPSDAKIYATHAGALKGYRAQSRKRLAELIAARENNV